MISSDKLLMKTDLAIGFQVVFKIKFAQVNLHFNLGLRI